jgi:hypothetical protein
VNLVFDVDLNRLITPDIDVSYLTYNEESIPLSIAYFTAPGSTSAYSKSNSQVVGAFGSSTNSDELHRIWEFAIDRQEIKAQNEVRMGLQVHSHSPVFDEIKPPNYRNDFSNLINIALVNGGTTGGDNATNATMTGGDNATTGGTEGSGGTTGGGGGTADSSGATPGGQPNTTTVSDPWWTRPEIIVPITVAIISSVIGPIVVSRYGKRHRNADETE